MKWIGQNIYDFAAKFRNDVYLEDLSTTTETNVLVVDSNGKVSKTTAITGDITGITLTATTGIDLTSVSGATGGAYAATIGVDVSDFMTGGADNYVLTATGTDAMQAETYLTFVNTGNVSTLSLISNEDDTDFCTIATTTNGATTITTVDEASTLAHFEIAADGNIILDSGGTLDLECAGGLTCDAQPITFTSDEMQYVLQGGAGPSFVLKNTDNDATSTGLIQFIKDKGGAGVDGDDIGQILFTADDSGQNLTSFAQILAEVSESLHTDEAGKLTLSVAESDGTTTALSPGLILEGEHATDGQVDVTIANGAASTTTIAGDLTVTSDLTVTGDTVTFESANPDDPQFTIKNTSNADNDAAQLFFVKDRGAAPAVGTNIGEVRFVGEDSGQNTQEYGGFLCEIDVATHGQESGKLGFWVATHDGELQYGLQMVGGSAEDEIDVTIGQGTASVTTIAGDLTVTSRIRRKIAVSSSTDGDYDGDVVYFGGTEEMVIGAIYHYKSDGTWEQADADAAATSDGLLGVALGANSDETGVLLRGMVTLDHDPGAIGDVLYLSTTAGDCSASKPSGNGDIVRIIGYQVSHASNGNIWFNPDNTFVEISA